MPTDKKRTNVALSEETHALAKALAARDRRTIGLLIEYLLRKYAEERGWTDLFAKADSLEKHAPEQRKRRGTQPGGESS